MRISAKNRSERTFSPITSQISRPGLPASLAIGEGSALNEKKAGSGAETTRNKRNKRGIYTRHTHMGRHLGGSLIDEIVASAEVERHVDTPVKH